MYHRHRRLGFAHLVFMMPYVAGPLGARPRGLKPKVLACYYGTAKAMVRW
jgi:hypothetical protein